MAHCPPELLDDVADVLADLGSWPGIVQRSRGVFYLRRQPFLHFHLLAGGRRCADIKGVNGWNRLDLPRPVSATKRTLLLRALRRHHGGK
jgi:hypothetical protein